MVLEKRRNERQDIDRRKDRWNVENTHVRGSQGECGAKPSC